MPATMQHVTSFFRSHSHPFDLPTEGKKTSRRNSSSRPSLKSRTPSSSASSIADDKAAKMPDLSLTHKRISIPGLHSPKTSSKSIPQYHGATLDCAIESPPLVLYGSTSSSTGALLSGQLKLHIHDEKFAIESFKMRLALEVTQKKPFHAHCHECTHQSKDLTTWNFLQGPATLRKGEHDFPFSFLLPGHLPASMKGSLSNIEYVLKATLVPKTGEPMKLSHILNIKRAIIPSDTPRNSIRIFPPTNLTANCQLPPVIYPIGEANISMRMDGVVNRNVDAKTQNHWKLKRLTWRLDETHRVISPACSKHASKVTKEGENKKGAAHQDARTLATEEIKSGWKSNYETADGAIEIEFPISIRPDAKPICDMKAEDGTEVFHTLIVEMIVSEEFAPIKKPTQVTPTGGARVLRMHFNLTVTERSGLGISWDEEQPPLYENVPASPPTYVNTDLYDGPPIPDYEHLPALDGASGSDHAPH
ncbi:uncharacterized protein EAF01_003362 [Botrytis porri]|uniref:LDB19 N-terminal domain-containing protein n=1 Tax=Botrytis porri TaxID=87229 RepID=A0A4Z1KK65_9HELO|nr:uncharacterized protein EAF01_003362 [Botrytis porri]KAF7909644.1 hypothetical protein EAF01_003362 [Botrytis porri]TGO85890.1 hypothetical protein BPOR_0354g00010 [Botrytis porri]